MRDPVSIGILIFAVLMGYVSIYGLIRTAAQTVPPLETTHVLSNGSRPATTDTSTPWCWSPKVGLRLPFYYRSGELEA